MYQVFDIAVHSSCPLPELQSTKRLTADIRFSLLPQIDVFEEQDWFHHWYSDAEKTEVACSVAREPDGYRLRYPERADFLISADLTHIQCQPLRDIAGDSLRHLFLDHVLPRVQGQSGQLILHASAVRSPGGKAFVFLGESGWGKSTIAASFCRHGYRLITDDCLKLMVNGTEILGIPGYGGSRLRSDSMEQLFPAGSFSGRVNQYANKQRIDLSVAGTSGGIVISELFLLVDPSENKSKRVTL